MTTIITPDGRTDKVADLLESLHRAVLELRQQAEDLKTALQAGEEVDPAAMKLSSAAVNSLVRECQKVETCFVERELRQQGIVQGGYALDLDAARFEIGCRLDRLRQCCGA